jgi:hypothetical protein
MAAKSGPASFICACIRPIRCWMAQPVLAVTDRNNLFGALEIAETLPGQRAGISFLRLTHGESDRSGNLRVRASLKW